MHRNPIVSFFPRWVANHEVCNSEVLNSAPSLFFPLDLCAGWRQNPWFQYNLFFKPKGKSGSRGLCLHVDSAVCPAKQSSDLLSGPGKNSSLSFTPVSGSNRARALSTQSWIPQKAALILWSPRASECPSLSPPSCPQWCLDIRHYLRSSEQDLKKTFLREKLCSSLLLISFLSCASAKKEIKLLPARSNVKPWPLQCQDCYLSFCASARNV